MARQTSIETYHAIEANGLLSQRRWAVYRTLFEIGPATAAEISEADDSSFTNPAKGDNSHARLNELIKQGCVEEVGTRICSITGREVLLYDVTKNLPAKLERKQSKAQASCDFIKRLFKNLENLNNAPIHGSEKTKRLALLLREAKREFEEL